MGSFLQKSLFIDRDFFKFSESFDDIYFYFDESFDDIYGLVNLGPCSLLRDLTFFFFTDLFSNVLPSSIRSSSLLGPLTFSVASVF